MRPDRFWMPASMLALMVLHLSADGGKESKCTPVFMVARDTIYEVAPGDQLTVECAVTLCEANQSNVRWVKYDSIPIGDIGRSRTITERKGGNRAEVTSYLMFKNIYINDSGQYQCEKDGQRSHLITVRVSDEFKKNSTDSEPAEWLYLSSAAGIAALVVVVVVVVVVSVVAVRGRKGESREEEQMESQYTTIPMAELPCPTRLQTSPRGSPSAPPCRRSIQGTPLGQERGRGRGLRTAKKDRPKDASIVYASLNHPLPPRGGARPRRPAEAPSEYAAIRVA